MNHDTVTIKQKITGGAMTAKQPTGMRYRWESVVTRGDALAMRQRQLQAKSQQAEENDYQSHRHERH